MRHWDCKCPQGEINPEINSGVYLTPAWHSPLRCAGLRTFDNNHRLSARLPYLKRLMCTSGKIPVESIIISWVRTLLSHVSFHHTPANVVRSNVRQHPTLRTNKRQTSKEVPLLVPRCSMQIRTRPT